MYIAPGQGQTNPWGQNFDVNRKALSFDHLLQVLKKSLWSPILYILFNVFMHVYSPRPGADNPLVTKFDVNIKPRSLDHLLHVSKWSLWIPILYTFLNYFIHIYSPGQEQTNPWGQNFDVNRKLLPLWPFIASLKKISLNSDFIHIF